MSRTVFSAQMVLSSVVVLTGCLRVWAAPAQEDKIAGTDPYGDLLPVGALSSLGTQRLSQLGIELLAISPDGKLVASAGAFARVFVWRIDSGKEARRFQAPMFKEPPPRPEFPVREVVPEVSALAFSPDSKLLALGCFTYQGGTSWRGAVLVWDVTTGKEVHKFEDISRPVSMAFSSDGKILVAGLQTGLILLLDPIKGNQIDHWDGFSGLRQIAFSDEGKTIVSLRFESRRDKYVTSLWDVATGKEKALREIERDGQYALALSPDGKTIAAPTEDGKVIRFIDPATGKELGRTGETPESLTRSAFTRDGSIFAALGRDGMIRVHETATGKLRREYRGHPMTLFDGDIALSADGKLVASSSSLQDYAVHLWDVAIGKEVHTFVGHRGGPLRVAFLPDGKTVATVSRFGRDGSWTTPPKPDWSLRLWDAPTGKQGHVEKVPQEGRIIWTEFTYDGTRLVTVRNDGRLRVWDVPEGKVIGEWQAPTLEYKSNNQKVIALNFHSLAISPDGNTVATVGEQEMLRFWNAKTGVELRKQKLGSEDVWNCLFSPDGKVLAVFVRDHLRGDIVLLLDAVSGQEIRRFPLAGTNKIDGLAFSADGKELAIVSGISIFVGEVASGKMLVEHTKLPSFSCGVAFSPDGQILATADQDGVIRLWMAGVEKPVYSFTGHFGVDSLAFSPDGRMLASGGSGSAAYVWDVADVLRGKLPDSVELGPKDLEAYWGYLASEDAATAYKARNIFISGAAHSVSWLQEKAKAFPPTDLSHLAESMKNLDSEKFETRMAAVDELVHLGVWAGPTVRKAMNPDSVSENARRLAKDILDKITTPPPECLREVRTLEVLEHIGTPEARKALEIIAKGTGLRQDEARACLERLRKRGVGKTKKG
jgi:WD40 repeat protein